MNESSKKVVMSGFFWKLLERFCAQGVSFIISIVLSRILLPSDYGEISLILIFITLADVFVSSGFNSALIQNKNSDELDFSTMFYCSLFMSIILYILLYMTAPLIANFYNNKSLILIIRVFSLKLPISALNSIQHAYVSRNMIFKKFFFSTIIGIIVSGVVGIIMAINGYGVWSLVTQYLVNSIMDTIVLLITIKWKPKLIFSFKRAKKLMNYGTKVLISEFSGTFFGQLRSLVIGKFFTSADLAYYNKGNQLPSLISSNVSTSIMSILFPAISNESDGMLRVKNMTKRSVKVLSYIMFPLLFGLAAVSKNLVLILFTDKWMGCILFVQLFCLSNSIGLLSTISLQTIKAIGRGDIVLKLEFIKKPMYIVLLILGMLFGVKGIAYSMVLYEIYGTIINMIQLNKCLGYSVLNQIKDIIPNILTTVIMYIMATLVTCINLNIYLSLILQILVGVIVYIGISIVTKNDSYIYIIEIVKEKMKKKVG